MNGLFGIPIIVDPALAPGAIILTTEPSIRAASIEALRALQYELNLSQDDRDFLCALQIAP